MLSLKRSSKRRCGKEKEKSPTERSVEEEKKEVQKVAPSPDPREDREAGERWDDIGDAEEMYLASTREELYELIMKRQTFKVKVKEKDVGELSWLMRSLFSYSRENVEELQLLQYEESRDIPGLRDDFARFTALISFQQRRIRWMVDEIIGRLRRTTTALGEKEKLMERLSGENSTLRRSLEVVVRERGDLLEKIDSRRVALRDVSVSTEDEAAEAEMANNLVLPPSGEISLGNREILEAIVENKVAEVLARVGLPLDGRTAGQVDPEHRVVQPPRKEDSWSEVVKRRRKKSRPPILGDIVPQSSKAAPASRGVSSPVEKIEGEKREPPPGAGRGSRRRKKRRVEWPAPPSTAAVVLSAPAGQEAACVELLRQAKERISIEEMGIPPLRVRRARMGGIILGVPGQHPQAGADCLAASLAGLAGGLGVRVSRPTKKADIRVSGLEMSSSEAEVVTAISRLTGCPRDGIRCGSIRRGPAGVGSLWLQCPIEAATTAAREGSVKVGWAHASVEMLRARPLRCYKCLEVGHVLVQCTSEVDRMRRCYRCGSEGHTALRCGVRAPQCPLCADKGRPYRHVLGGKGCCNDIPPPTRRGSGGGGEMAVQDGRAASSAAG